MSTNKLLISTGWHPYLDHWLKDKGFSGDFHTRLDGKRGENDHKSDRYW